jgi:hypothetical protein
MAVSQQVVLQGVQEVTEEMVVTTAVPQAVAVSLLMVELEHTVLVGLHSPTEVTEVTTDPMRFVLVDLVEGEVPTGTPVEVAVAVATLVVLEDSIIHLPEAVAVEVPIITVPTKPMLVEYELDMDW